jgi:gliding motility-associated-like protein
MMKKPLFLSLITLALAHLPMLGQTVNPQAYYTDDEGNELETRNVDKGQAPLEVEFRANPEGMDAYTPSYEWHFRFKKDVDDERELFVRYEENTTYTFTESGTYYVTLKTSLEPNAPQLVSDSIIVVVPESRLEFPNAFSPNNDGKNDKYGAIGVNVPESPKHWKSIVEFHAYIFNRWGQKLYEWHDPAGYWDGKHNGHDVPDGVYFVVVNAKGADGRRYNFRKDVNLLRADNSESNGGGTTN